MRKDVIETLTGFKFNTAQLSDDKQRLTLISNDENYQLKDKLILEAEADCCSETWIEDFYCVSGELNSRSTYTIKEVKELDLPTYVSFIYDSISLYGYELECIDENKKRLVLRLEFRSASNGYYGGSLCIKEENDEL